MTELPNCAALRVERIDAHILLVTMDRPEVLNAIDTEMGQCMHDLVQHLARDPGDLRAVVLAGAGRAFCSGADLRARHGQSDRQLALEHRLAELTYEARVESPLPWIAAVQGVCYAGGLEAALTCDFIYADNSARFAFTECRLGFMPGCMGTQTLPRAVGERRAKELIMTATPFGADEASQWGLVNKVCEEGTVVREALACAARIAACAPLAVRQLKQSIHFGMQSDLHTAYRFELEAWHRLMDTEDRREGIRAFVEKRAPVFSGR